eukprot:975321-Prymnesium_polylepis.2
MERLPRDEFGREPVSDRGQSPTRALGPRLAQMCAGLRFLPRWQRKRVRRGAPRDQWRDGCGAGRTDGGWTEVGITDMKRRQPRCRRSP